MKLTEEQMKSVKEKIGKDVEGEFLQDIIKEFPENMPFGILQDPLVVILKREGTNAKPADVAKEIKALLMAKKSMEGKEGDTKKITREYFDSLLIEQRLLGSVFVDTSVTLFGNTFSTPIMTAALSHLGAFHADLPNGMYGYALAAREADTLHWVGMCEDDEFIQIMEAGAKTVRIIKPYESDEKIRRQIETAANVGVVAVGIDIDHVFTRSGEPDLVMGEQMMPKTLEQYRDYIGMAKELGLPFVIKGVLSVCDAVKAKELGAEGIVVSHHGGRMDYAVPPLQILPEIVRGVGESMHVFVDCGIQSGMDAYKALALGADAVGVGNHLVPYLKKGGVDAVVERMKAMTKELKGVMAYTGVADTSKFDATVLHKKCLSDG